MPETSRLRRSLQLAVLLGLIVIATACQAPPTVNAPSSGEAGNPSAPTAQPVAATPRPTSTPAPVPTHTLVAPVQPTASESTATPQTTERKIGPEQGALAPDFQLASVQGPNVMLSELKGSVVLLNFWTTW